MRAIGVEAVGVTKRFGAFTALDNVSLRIAKASVHALLGENGAGKSTLVKAIYGLIQPSEGEMRWQGEKMILTGPSEARARGTGVDPSRLRPAVDDPQGHQRSLP